MNLIEIIKTRRSIRNFKQNEIPNKDLEEIIDCARTAPSAANIQPLEYIVLKDKNILKEIFKTTKWAGYLKDGVPQKGEEPTVFIIVLINNEKVSKWGALRDAGSAIENILIASHIKNIGTCWIISFDNDKVRDILNIDKKYTIDSLIAMGYSNQKSEFYNENNEVKYWKDENGNMHVPKRTLDSICKFV